MLVLHGLADKITSPAMSKALYHGAASADKTFIGYEGAWHSLWFEPATTVDTVLSDIVEWLSVRATARARLHHDDVITRRAQAR